MIIKLLKNMTADNILYKLDKKHIKHKIEKLNNMSDDEYIYKSAIARNFICDVRNHTPMK